MDDEVSAALSGLLRDYERRTNTHRFNDLAPLIAEDATYWFTEGSFTGREAIKQAVEATWERIRDEQYSLHDLRWIAVDAHVAVCLYTFHWKGLVGGEAREGVGRGTSVLRQDAGRWTVIHEHLSRVPPEDPD